MMEAVEHGYETFLFHELLAVRLLRRQSDLPRLVNKGLAAVSTSSEGCLDHGAHTTSYFSTTELGIVFSTTGRDGPILSPQSGRLATDCLAHFLSSTLLGRAMSHSEWAWQGLAWSCAK